MQKHTEKPKLTDPSSTARTAHYKCAYRLCSTAVHNTAQNSSDNLLSYAPDNHSSDVVCWREGVYHFVHQNVWHNTRVNNTCLMSIRSMALPAMGHWGTCPPPSPQLPNLKANYPSTVLCSLRD